MGDDQDLSKVTVNLTPRAYNALIDAAAITGDSRTDTINRALQIYVFVVGSIHIGQHLFLGRRRWRSKEVTADWFNKGNGSRGR